MRCKFYSRKVLNLNPFFSFFIQLLLLIWVFKNLKMSIVVTFFLCFSQGSWHCLNNCNIQTMEIITMYSVFFEKRLVNLSKIWLGDGFLTFLCYLSWNEHHLKNNHNWFFLLYEPITGTWPKIVNNIPVPVFKFTSACIIWVCQNVSVFLTN